MTIEKLISSIDPKDIFELGLVHDKEKLACALDDLFKERERIRVYTKTVDEPEWRMRFTRGEEKYAGTTVCPDSELQIKFTNPMQSSSFQSYSQSICFKGDGIKFAFLRDSSKQEELIGLYISKPSNSEIHKNPWAHHAEYALIIDK